ncbi:MAG: MoxR family ATPase [Rhodobacter sp.]|nr:MoxR family ATPase [Rhodobacter sp.]
MTVNAMKVSAGDAYLVLEAAWHAQAQGGLMASYMLHGRPGVGKSQVVGDLAAKIGARLYDVRLTTIEPQDLRGLPYYDHDTQKTKWYRPEDLPDDPARPSVLFLDELTAAQPYLQPTVYGLLQERRIGQHRLPGSVFIVAAGNAVEDGAVAYEMNTALSDRLIHLTVQANAAQWLDHYAAPRGLHPAVIAFIKTRADLLETTETALNTGQMIACTPRSWERVSQIMTSVPDRKLRNIMIAGTVGEAAAAEFALIADDIAATVQVTELLAAKPADRHALYPATIHGLNALIYGLVGLLSEDTVADAVSILAGIRHIAQHRPEPAFKRLPLAELTTYGFELLIAKALDQDLGPHILSTPAYQDYTKGREAIGLA